MIQKTPIVSLLEGLRSQAIRNPDSHALLAPNCEPLTYSQLLHQAESVGRALRSVGIGRSDCVAVVLPNGAELAATIVGLAAHTQCAPLNPLYHRENLEFYLSDVKARAIVVPADTELAARDAAAKLGLMVIELEPASNGVIRGISGEGTATVESNSDRDIALVLHTSGTTSLPRQVPLTHRNLCSSAQNIANTLSLSSQDCCLNVMPLFHIHGIVGALLSTVLTGGSVVCSEGFDHLTFVELMQRYQPTWITAAPTIHQSILSLVDENPFLSTKGRLRFIRSSSSALPPNVLLKLEETFQVPVIESYGMTEAAHQMASNPISQTERKIGSVGLPAGSDMAIMDESGRLLKTGETGEIVIRGENVTAGYTNNPEANEVNFTNGWFRTGDIGRKDDEGYYFISGRKKEIIIRGGENISPREIDELLLEHEAVAQAIVYAVPHQTLGEDLAALVVLHTNGTVTERELRQFAFDRLPAFKVPTHIRIVDEIPTGPTGKLMRIGLHAVMEEQFNEVFIAPQTDLEHSIVAAIAEVLEISEVGMTHNFFALGGDSLKAARVLGELSTQYHVQLSAITLFLHPTPQELTLEITRHLAESSGTLESLLAEIEAMSEEEARRQLD